MNFSVLTSVYRNEKPTHLDSALESIWDNQSIKPTQLVIVKDGLLTPQLEDILTKWKIKLGNVLKFIEFPENRGLGAALRVGLEACEYELVARMDTDDVAETNRFKQQLCYLKEHPEIDILGSSAKEVNYLGETSVIREVPILHDEIISCLWASPMIHPSIMMRRSRILEAGNYDASYRRRQDYELWFRCAEKGLRFHNLSEPLLLYRFGAHTHKKQTPKLAWEQAMIGYKGGKKIGLPIYYRLSCFLPFVRSLLPTRTQHYFYKAFKSFDPRQKN